MNINTALVGDYNPQVIAHQAIPKALEHSSKFLQKHVSYRWMNSETIIDDIKEQFNNFNGIWVVPASPYKNMDGVLNVIKYARENNIPFLGTCGGFQHAVIEFFRNVIGYKIADNLESNLNSEMPVISQLTCSLVDKVGDIFLKENTRIKDFCKTEKLTEKFHCNYGFNSKYIDLLNESKLKISGVDINEEIRIVELEDHPFFIGTLFQPERSALLEKHHPIINAFVSSSALY
jgi:CTP synthase (UTP-ammonia lyase)